MERAEESYGHLDVDFRNSMANVVSREALKDGELADWEERFRDPIDAVVLAAHDNVGKTAALTASLKELIEDAGGTIVHVQHGSALKNARGDGIVAWHSDTTGSWEIAARRYQRRWT